MERLIDPSSPFPRKLSEHIWLLGNYYFNLFLVKGENASALIEVGVSAVTDLVIEQLEELNLSPDHFVVTHPHADHLTGLPGLKAHYPNAGWICAEGAPEFISHPKALPTFINDDRFMHQALTNLGHIPGQPPIEAINLGTPELVISENTSMDLGAVHLNFMRAAGHSPGSLIVHIPEHRAVIASDSLGFHFNGRCFLPLYFTNYQAFVSTLEQIRSLTPTILGLGHQSPFVGSVAEKALELAWQSTLNLYARIRQDERDDNTLAEALYVENYRDEFTIYTPDNIRNCCQLLVKRSRTA
jgi:2-aminobenzoylacetyl-CoA thioesterase